MDRIQLRRDTSARWAEINPILLEGEVGYEIDTKFSKIGDGATRWNDLEYLKAENIVQETGDDKNVVMSQKAVTEKIKNAAINNNLVLLYEHGYINSYDGVIVKDNKSKFVLIPVNSGDIFYYYCDINGLDLNCFFDVHMNMISGSRFIITLGEQKIIVPNKAKYLGITVEYDDGNNKRGNIASQLLYKENDYINKLVIETKQEIDTLKPINIEFTRGGYYTAGTGVFQSYAGSAYTKEYYIISNISKYIYTGRPLYEVAACVFYDKNKNFISTFPENPNLINSLNNYVIQNIPDNAVYIRFSAYSDIHNDYNVLRLPNIVNNKPFLGKKWACLGDSLTEKNIRATKNYHDYVSEDTGISVINLGKSGTGYKRDYNGALPFYQRITDIPTDIDVVTIFGSGNDLGFEIGNPSDNTNDTICGCINLTIKNLLQHIPTCKIGIITPTPWWTYTPNINNNKMMQMCDAIIAVANRWSIPVLDLYRQSNLHPDIEACRNITYSKDDGGGVHPDENGHKIIANRFKEFISAII